jgi:hypothetical protein
MISCAAFTAYCGDMDQHGALHQAANQPPGGYPPGGAPPGGYGPPPGGYGPPPGGYGPPPGGYGPPPGGYGPPPGGYGPPRGGYGPPPGGYGPPPGGYGGAPYGYGGPPPPKKSNVGLILGVGCGALLLVGILAGAVIIYMTGKAAREVASALPAPPAAPVDSGFAEPQATGSLSAEIRDLRGFKAGVGKLHFFVGEIHNTGTEPLGFPSAKVTLYDGAGVALESGACTSLVRILPPHEKVPCTFTATKTAAFATFKAEIEPMRPLFKGQLAKLSITDTRFTPKRGATPYQVEGKITNESTFTARSVWSIVSLYGADGKIVAVSQALVAGNDLAPGASGLFAARILEAADPPATWQVLAVGYSE